MRVTVRRARPEDAAALAELAARVYYDTFADSTTPEDMQRFLARAYNETRQRAEIEDREMTTLLAEEGELVGYAQLRRGQAPPSVTGPTPVEIYRFYVDRSRHGRGVAQALMAEVLRVARDLGAATLWLGVWEHNERAKAFYSKYGFRHVGEVPFVVGDDVQTDWVLECRVENSG